MHRGARVDTLHHILTALAEGVACRQAKGDLLTVDIQVGLNGGAAHCGFGSRNGGSACHGAHARDTDLRVDGRSNGNGTACAVAGRSKGVAL